MRIRKITAAIAAASTVALFVPPALADTWPTEVYDSVGECTRDLHRLRNERRQAGDTGRYVGWGTYNAYVRYYLDCVEVGSNAWVIMRVNPRG